MSDRKPTPDIMGDLLGPLQQARSLRIADIRRDGGTQPRDGVKDALVAEYARLMQDDVDLGPVDVMYDGTSYWLWDGYHRTAAAEHIGRFTVMAIVHQGTQTDAQWESYGANKAHGLNRSQEDKERAVKAALHHPKGATTSDRDIAAHVGVSHPTVAKYRAELEAGGKITTSPTRTGADGKTYDTATISANAADKAKRQGMTKEQYAHHLAPIVGEWLFTYRDPHGRPLREILDSAAHSNSTHWQAITREFNRREIYWDDDTLKDAIKIATSIVGSSARVQPATSPNNIDYQDTAPVDPVPVPASKENGQEFSSPQDDADDVLTPVPVSRRDGYDSDEWYTPAEYIEAARTVMGGIDLDPATCEMAQTVVQAENYLTKIENGLAMTWICERVWLNPPYSNPDAWISKLVNQYEAKEHVKQACVLVNNATETAWFQMLLSRYPVCFPSKRLAFWRHDHEGVQARQGQAIFYLGSNVAQFAKTFGEFGPVLRRMA
jgi:phage N-6-adenine-methyltransferase